MFTWLNKQGVRSDNGFELQFTSRFTAEYREADRVVDLEVDGAPEVILTNDEPLHWRLGSRLSNEDRERVLSNIRAALEFMDLTLFP